MVNKAKLFVVDPTVALESALETLEKVNLQAVTAAHGKTLVVVSESEEVAVEALLKTAFEENVTVCDATLCVPEDWSKTGFVLQVAREHPGARYIVTSGRGVLVVEN